MEKKKYYPIRNSLTIIALFIGLTEIAIGIYFSKAPTNYQTPLVWFLVIFPIIYIIGFFAVLFYRPQNFYGPGDFKKDESYISLYKQAVKSTEESIPIANSSTTDVKIEKPDLESSESVLAGLVKPLDPKVCWYLLKVKDKKLSFDEHLDLLMAEMQDNNADGSYHDLRYIGYLQCLWSNSLNSLFILKKVEEEKLILELDSKVSELIARKLGLLEKSAG